jgi:capsule biosynthesis phosphatase
MHVPQDKRIVVDVDGVIAQEDDVSYSDREVNENIRKKLKKYREDGFYIILHTARNMRTYNGRIGKINVETAPELLDWLNKNNVPFDEIIYGKPWCGNRGFYVDDRAIRPEEFKEKTFEEIKGMIE